MLHSSGDKNDLRLPESQRILIQRVMETGKPVIIVCASGSSVNTESEPDAIIQAWYPGSEGGKAPARIIFGDISPSGKLPGFTDYSMKNRTYRYADGNILFPFGFGLTYSDIVCTDVRYENDTAYISAENRGTRDTEDVVELYIKDYSENAVPNASLCGFKRIFLKAGEKGRFEISVPERAFTSVSESGERKIYGSRFTLYAGTHQPDELSEKLGGGKCVCAEIELS